MCSVDNERIVHISDVEMPLTTNECFCRTVFLNECHNGFQRRAFDISQSSRVHDKINMFPTGKTANVNLFIGILFMPIVSEKYMSPSDHPVRHSFEEIAQ